MRKKRKKRSMRSQAGKKAWETRRRNELLARKQEKEEQALRRKIAGKAAYDTWQRNGTFDPERHTLTDFVRLAGGLHDRTWSGEAKMFSIKECGMSLLNYRTGKCFETLLEMAIEETFFPVETDVDAFIASLEQDVFAKRHRDRRRLVFSMKKQDFDDHYAAL